MKGIGDATRVGDPKLTIKMKNAHTKYMADFDENSPKDEKGEPFQWQPWLQFNGYGLDSNGHVIEMDNTAVEKKRREYQ
jgi:hypothetical protein